MLLHQFVPTAMHQFITTAYCGWNEAATTVPVCSGSELGCMMRDAAHKELLSELQLQIALMLLPCWLW